MWTSKGVDDMGRLRSCQYCGKVHPTDFDCGKRPVRRKETTAAIKMRNSGQWRRVRLKALERDHHLCRVCLEAGRYTYEGLEVHHIFPLVEDAGRAYDLGNIVTLCTRCHKEADAGKIDRLELQRLANLPVVSPPGGVG